MDVISDGKTAISRGDEVGAVVEIHTRFHMSSQGLRTVYIYTVHTLVAAITAPLHRADRCGKSAQ